MDNLSLGAGPDAQKAHNMEVTELSLDRMFMPDIYQTDTHLSIVILHQFNKAYHRKPPSQGISQLLLFPLIYTFWFSFTQFRE